MAAEQVTEQETAALVKELAGSVSSKVVSTTPLPYDIPKPEYILPPDHIAYMVRQVKNHKLNRLVANWKTRNPRWFLERTWTKLPSDEDRLITFHRWLRVTEGFHQGIFGKPFSSLFPGGAIPGEPEKVLPYIYSIMEVALLTHLLELNTSLGMKADPISVWLCARLKERGVTITEKKG